MAEKLETLHPLQAVELRPNLNGRRFAIRSLTLVRKDRTGVLRVLAHSVCVRIGACAVRTSLSTSHRLLTWAQRAYFNDTRVSTRGLSALPASSALAGSQTGRSGGGDSASRVSQSPRSLAVFTACRCCAARSPLPVWAGCDFSLWRVGC